MGLANAGSVIAAQGGVRLEYLVFMAPKLSDPLKPSDSHVAVVSSSRVYRRPLGWRSEVGEFTIW